MESGKPPEGFSKRTEGTFVQATMNWIGLRYAALLVLCCASLSPQASAQRFTFGLITGINATEDFRTMVCPDLSNAEPVPGCPLIFGGSIGVSDVSRRFIIGPKLTLHFAPSFSVEVNALYRPIRTVNTTTFSFCLPAGQPDCTETPFTHSFTGTDFSWEFPVLAKFQFSDTRMTPFIEGGPSFRPKENGEIYGLTAGAGVKLKLHSLSLSPTIRYTHWDKRDRYLGLNEDQLQFVVGLDGPESSERVSAFGRKISVGFVGGIALTDGLQRSSSRPFDTLVVNPATGMLTPATGTQTENISRTSPVFGVALELAVNDRLSIEFDGLYRPLNSQDFTDTASLGFTRSVNFTVLTWEFPILAKYRVPIRSTTPFFELGPALRASGNLNGANPSRYGIASGLGLEIHAGRFTIAPTLRFTRWAADQSAGSMATHRNQAELVFGFRF